MGSLYTVKKFTLGGVEYVPSGKQCAVILFQTETENNLQNIKQSIEIDYTAHDARVKG
jgi:hypothetical protein